MAHELTPQDIKDIRAKYGLSQRSFARLLGLGEASLARYEKDQKPSRANANLIRAARLPRFVMDFREGASRRRGNRLCRGLLWRGR